jgi:cytochrome c-type biogenesis protein CcmH
MAIALLLAVATSAAAAAQEARASLPDVEDEVMCTICGTLLEESQSPQADRERALIRELIAQGQDKDQIKDALVAQYGPRVLATPGTSGFDLFAWLVPAAGLLFAAAVVTIALRRMLRTREVRGAGPTLDPADAEKLEADMAQHDL